MKKYSVFLFLTLMIVSIGAVLASGEEIGNNADLGSDDYINVDIKSLIDERTGGIENVINTTIDEEQKSSIQDEFDDLVKTDKEKNLMILGKEVDIKGEAKDLIMALGEKITSKAVGSYAFMAAGDLDVSGEIYKDTFAIGNNVNVLGDVGRDLYVLGNTINITGTVQRDVYAGGETLWIAGNVYGDVTFFRRDYFY